MYYLYNHQCIQLKLYSFLLTWNKFVYIYKIYFKDIYIILYKIYYKLPD